jgi:hypothetical protein
VTLGSGKFKAAGIKGLIDASLAYIQSKFDLGEDLKPVIAEVTFGFLLVYNSTIHCRISVC